MRTILIYYESAAVYVCLCNAITDREIRGAADLGARTIDDLRDMLGVASCCRRCEGCAKDVLARAIEEPACAGCGD